MRIERYKRGILVEVYSRHNPRLWGLIDRVCRRTFRRDPQSEYSDGIISVYVGRGGIVLHKW